MLRLKIPKKAPTANEQPGLLQGDTVRRKILAATPSGLPDFFGAQSREGWATVIEQIYGVSAGFRYKLQLGLAAVLRTADTLQLLVQMRQKVLLLIVKQQLFNHIDIDAIV